MPHNLSRGVRLPTGQPLPAGRSGVRGLVYRLTRGRATFASNYGQHRNPSWYYNLRAHPAATIVFEGAELQVTARELEGEERERHYARGIEIYPGWEQYRKRASHRQIPVIELTPVE